MVKFNEIKLLNTHYFLSPQESLSQESTPFPTICPDVLHLLRTHPEVPYWTPCNKWLYCISREDVLHSHPSSEDIQVPFQYVLMEDMYMLRELQDSDTSILAWLTRYWKSPFLVSHPIYQYTLDPSQFHVFSTMYARTIIVQASTELLEPVIEHGCFSMGNGLILGLSMVALGHWKEQDFLRAIELLLQTMEPKPLDATLPFYTPLYGDWMRYTEIVPYSITDHIFRYTFQFLSQRMYAYFYRTCKNENYLTYHITMSLPKAYISTVFHDVSTKEQFLFLYEKKRIRKGYNQTLSYFPNAHLHLNVYRYIQSIVKNTSLFQFYLSSEVLLKQLLYYISLSSKGIYIRILRACMLLEKEQGISRRRVFLFYQRYMQHVPEKTQGAFLLDLTERVLSQKQGNQVVFPSKKWTRLHMFQNQRFRYHTSSTRLFTLRKDISIYFPFPYTILEDIGTKLRIQCEVSWKQIFTWIETEGGPCYATMMAHRMVRKLKTVKQMVSSHTDGHLLYFLLQEHYRTHPEELWA